MPADIDTPASVLSRRALLVNGAAMAAVATLPNGSKAAQKENAMTTATTEQSSTAAADKNAIRPFQVPTVPDADLADLRRRINATRWPDPEYVPDATQGVQFATTQKLARYWGNDYDWRKCEARLKALPHFLTEIDGLDIHFIHVRSKHDNALPMIVTHGWPGSIIEQLKIIEPLTNPTAHGGTAADAFHLVIPSLPGYGFSGKPTAPGWDPARIARAWTTLMKRLGYTKFVAQGGDWGALVVETMGLQAPPELLAIHTNMAATVPPEIASALASGGPQPANFSADEKQRVGPPGLLLQLRPGLRHRNEQPPADAVRDRRLTGWPRGLDDRPRRAELRRDRAQLRRKAGGLDSGRHPRQHLLYWFTNTAISSARLYWENRRTAKAGFFDVKGVTIPVAVSVFPQEIYAAPKSWAERAYPKLIHYNKLPKGCHFAAWEQPGFFVSEMRTSFKSLR